MAYPEMFQVVVNGESKCVISERGAEGMVVVEALKDGDDVVLESETLELNFKYYNAGCVGFRQRVVVAETIVVSASWRNNGMNVILANEGDTDRSHFLTAFVGNGELKIQRLEVDY